MKRSGPLSRSTRLQRGGKIKAVNPEQRAKRRQRNADYYASSEWRAKRKAVFERDGYQCTETVRVMAVIALDAAGALHGFDTLRCPNRGEIVNGKQTGRGLVCEEKSYGHRGHPDRINTCTTRCKDCDRRRTPLERANHVNGFRR